MTPVDLSLMFLLGLAGSLHCVQMCGPLVLSLDMAGGSRGLRGHLLYHSGRLATYGFLGALAGWLGTAVNLVFALRGIADRAAVFSGVLMVIAGLLLAGTVKSEKLIQIGTSSKIAKIGGRLLRSQSRFLTGLVLGFLPCGLIFAALLKSLGAASPVAGGFAMVAFGLGTAGPLIGLGAFSSVLTRRFRSQRLAAVGIMVMGVFLVWRGMMPVTPACHLHHP